MSQRLTACLDFITNKILKNFVVFSGPEDDGWQEPEGWAVAAGRQPNNSLPGQGDKVVHFCSLNSIWQFNTAKVLIKS